MVNAAGANVKASGKVTVGGRAYVLSTSRWRGYSDACDAPGPELKILPCGGVKESV